jgi:hypothetical protein
MPANPTPHQGIPGSIQTTGELIDVEYSTRSWSDQKNAPLVQALPGSPVVQAAGATGSLQSQVAAGDWSETGTSYLQDQQVIELSWNDSGPGSTQLLWVNAATYLPVQEIFTYLAGTTSSHVQGTIESEYEYLSPSTANIDQLQPTIPQGFAETVAPPNHPGG